MGAPKQKWTTEEEEALRAGVDKHGAGKWRTIQKDPEFGHCLAARSNIDLKDKWRNMSVSASGQGSREKVRAPKSKSLALVPFTSTPSASTSLAVAQEAQPTGSETLKGQQEAKSPLMYNAVIMEALSALQDPNGSDVNAICHFIEQKHKMPPTFRRVLTSKLRRLIVQDKIEKAPNGYKLKDPSFAMKTPTPKSRLPQTSSFNRAADAAEEATMTAAYKIADAEAKSYLASQAVKEAERVSRMAEETDSLLQIAKEIFDQCLRGEIVSMA
ncbi:single myb histone 3-like isoform X1 [Aristolochia californica]|uniref:single myb histone 3-like isoform X1 n=1 Tax=Aristolochia californica TaxID=171875 RepID=UPI0035DF4F73